MKKHLDFYWRARLVLRALDAYECFEKALPDSYIKQGMTTTQIARTQGMCPSAHLRRVLAKMVELGWLVDETTMYRRHIRAKTYFISGKGRLVLRAYDDGMVLS